MASFMEFLRKSAKFKCDIHIKIDEDKEEAITEVEGNLPSVLTGLSLLISTLKEKKVPEELIEGAIEVGLEKKHTNTEKKQDKVEIKCGSIELEGEKAKEFKKFLESMGVEL